MLEVERISCGYAGREILHGVSFSLAAGEMAGVIGPNGSGKTTLLRALSGALRFRGMVRLHGRAGDDISPQERSRLLAVVSQDHAGMADLTVDECVALGRIPHQRRWQFFESAADEAVITTALAEAGIETLRDRRLSTLSGGERQLVFIAQALAQEPKILLLDEPVVFLDIFHQVHILELIDRLRRQQGLAVLIVLHELNLAGEYCDRLLLLQQGRVRAVGEPAAVLTQAIVSEVYGTPVIITQNPRSGRPQVALDREQAHEWARIRLH